MDPPRGSLNVLPIYSKIRWSSLQRHWKTDAQTSGDYKLALMENGEGKIITINMKSFKAQQEKIPKLKASEQSRQGSSSSSNNKLS